MDEFSCISVSQAIIPIKGCVSYHSFRFREGTFFLVGDKHMSFFDTTSRRHNHQLETVDDGTSVLTSYLVKRKLASNSERGIETALYLESRLTDTPFIPEYDVARRSNYRELESYWTSLNEIMRIENILLHRDYSNCISIHRLDSRRRLQEVEHSIFKQPVTIDLTCELNKELKLAEVGMKLYPWTKQFHYYGLSFEEYLSRALELAVFADRESLDGRPQTNIAGKYEDKVRLILSRSHMVDGKSVVYDRLSRLKKKTRRIYATTLNALTIVSSVRRTYSPFSRD